MAAPYYQYKTLYSTGNEPDIGIVNVEAQNGWVLDQVLVNRPDWAYVLRKQIIDTGPSRSRSKTKKKRKK